MSVRISPTEKKKKKKRLQQLDECDHEYDIWFMSVLPMRAYFVKAKSALAEMWERGVTVCASLFGTGMIDSISFTLTSY
jgi:hypothetical protein